MHLHETFVNVYRSYFNVYIQFKYVYVKYTIAYCLNTCFTKKINIAKQSRQISFVDFQPLRR